MGDMRIFSLLIFMLFLLLSGCAAGPDAPPIHPVRSINDLKHARPHGFIAYPEPERFTICHGHTCKYISEVSLNEDEWSGILSIFKSDARSPEQERMLIAGAIARFEIIVGARTGTDANLGGNFTGLGRPGQMDCIDESTNTTVYLTLLQNHDLLRWHRVDHRTTRAITYFNYPHSSAVIREIETGKRYAVDSWFEDNGKPPHIVPLSLWRRGWEPDQKTDLAGGDEFED
jgi:hypothetical protein